MRPRPDAGRQAAEPHELLVRGTGAGRKWRTHVRTTAAAGNYRPPAQDSPRRPGVSLPRLAGPIATALSCSRSACDRTPDHPERRSRSGRCCTRRRSNWNHRRIRPPRRRGPRVHPEVRLLCYGRRKYSRAQAPALVRRRSQSRHWGLGCHPSAGQALAHCCPGNRRHRYRLPGRQLPPAQLTSDPQA